MTIKNSTEKQLTPKTVTYYEWTDIRDFFCREMGITKYQFRDRQEKYANSADQSKEYQDFWHVWLWLIDERIMNDSYMPFWTHFSDDPDGEAYLQERLKERFGVWAWDIIEPLRKLTEQVGDTEEIVIHYSW